MPNIIKAEKIKFLPNLYRRHLVLIFLAPVLIDFLNGYILSNKSLSIPLGSIYRVFIIILILKYLFFSKDFLKKINYLKVVSFLFIILVPLWLLVSNNSYVVRETEQISRVLSVWSL